MLGISGPGLAWGTTSWKQQREGERERITFGQSLSLRTKPF